MRRNLKTSVQRKEIELVSTNLPAPVGQAGKQPIVSPFSQGNIVPAIVIAAVAVLLYYNGLQVYIHGEVWWDFPNIEVIRSNFYMNRGNIRPVSHALEDLIRFIFGLDNPLPFHAIVLGLHVANSILVFLILKKVINCLVGLFGALLFTSFFAHPDVVTYHYGMNEALRTTFCFSCIILFYRYRGNPTRTNYILTVGAFILAVGSRETTALILLPLVYLVDRYFQIESKSKGIKPSKGVYIPFIIISIAWLPLMYTAGEGKDVSKLIDSPMHLYLSTVTSFNLCLLKGPGYGTLILVLSLVLSFLPLFDMRTKRCIVLLWLGWLITIIPLMKVGMNPRYLYITSALSMAILTTCVYHFILYVVGRFRLKEAYVTFLSILVFSVPVITNFLYVSRHVEYLKDTGRVSESLLKPILADFPRGTLGTKLVFINLPYMYEPTPGSGYIGTRHIIWWDLFTMFASVYGRRDVGPVYRYTLPELYNGRHPLARDMQKLSPQEYEELAMEKGTKVYLFNPRNDAVQDVTGRDYNSLKKLVSR